MNCPKCKIGKLKETTLSGLKVKDGVDSLTVDRCFACGGVWFDAHELDAAVREWVIDDLQQSFSIISGDPKERQEFDSRPTECPRCAGTVLSRKRMKKVIVDVCGKCRGVWVDGDELAHFDSGEEDMQGKLENALDSPSFNVRFFAKLFLMFRRKTQ